MTRFVSRSDPMASGRTVPMGSAVALLREDLITRIGDNAVSDDPERLAAYASDTYWRALAAQAAGDPLGRPDLVAVPRDEAGVSAALELADEHRVPVVPWGGGSGTQGGAVPVRGGLLLDLSGLDRILGIDERSLTVSAEAGVNGRRLERELNERGLMLPHYPASAEWATVGGYIAARGSGVLATRYAPSWPSSSWAPRAHSARSPGPACDWPRCRGSGASPP